MNEGFIYFIILIISAVMSYIKINIIDHEKCLYCGSYKTAFVRYSFENDDEYFMCNDCDRMFIKKEKDGNIIKLEKD